MLTYQIQADERPLRLALQRAEKLVAGHRRNLEKLPGILAGRYLQGVFGYGISRPAEKLNLPAAAEPLHSQPRGELARR